jgi:cytoskeletal protein CcmA (bactofilin family)
LRCRFPIEHFLSAGAFFPESAIVTANGRDEDMAVENTPARIGKSVEIRGEVKGSEDLIVDGHVEGTVTLSESRLTIGATAQVSADLVAKDVLILGRVQGNVVASGRVELRSGCSVEGDIRALRLSVEDNAVFRGKVDLTQGAAKAPEGASPATAGGTA